MTTPRVTVPVEFGDETAEQIVRRWASWINDVSADMEEPECGGKTHNDVLNERDFLIRSLSAAPAPEGGAVTYVAADGATAHRLATREEAPAEAGERDYPAEFEAWWATYRHRNRDVADYSVKKQIAFDAFYHAALRARSSAPPAREDAQPVAWRMVGPDGGLIGMRSEPYHGGFERMMKADVGCVVQPLYIHPAPDTLRVAISDIAAERQRQVVAEGRSPKGDDGYSDAELAKAAAAYTLSACGFSPDAAREMWPRSWSAHWWKPTTARRDLVKAGALIVAEIERLDRQALATREESPAEAGERLLRPAGSKPTRCYCPPDRCYAPVIMGRQTPCPRAEEAQPVGVVDGLIGRLNTAELDDGTPLYTHPAPDALRVAVEALTEARSELEAYERQLTGETYNNLKLNSALAALQAEQGAK